MAKAKYKQNSRGEWETKIWNGTYNADGSKHRKRLVSKKSSADLEKQVMRLKSDVENGQYIQNTDIMFTDYAAVKHWHCQNSILNLQMIKILSLSQKPLFSTKTHQK